MGYATAYSLEVKQIDSAVQKVEKTLDDLIQSLLLNKEINKQELMEQLNQVKNGYANVDESYIFTDLRKTYSEARYALSEEGSTNNSSKWYDHETDLKEFSKKYPNWLFTLSGEGEESGDIWKAYFVNGKVQVAKARIVIDDFDVKKLK